MYVEGTGNVNRKTNSIKIDYLSMIFNHIEEIELIQRVLDLPFEFFRRQEAHVRHQAYTSLCQCAGIKAVSPYGRDITKPMAIFFTNVVGRSALPYDL